MRSEFTVFVYMWIYANNKLSISYYSQLGLDSICLKLFGFGKTSDTLSKMLTVRFGEQSHGIKSAFASRPPSPSSSILVIDSLYNLSDLITDYGNKPGCNIRLEAGAEKGA
jgi:hypothetical protein